MTRVFSFFVEGPVTPVTHRHCEKIGKRVAFRKICMKISQLSSSFSPKFVIFAKEICNKRKIDMPVQSEAALENGLIDTLQKMNYEYVHIEEEKNLSTFMLS